MCAASDVKAEAIATASSYDVLFLMRLKSDARNTAHSSTAMFSISMLSGVIISVQLDLRRFVIDAKRFDHRIAEEVVRQCLDFPSWRCFHGVWLKIQRPAFTRRRSL